MVNFTVDQIRSLMDFQDNIRNMSVIAHVDHGKSTLTDSLICRAGIIAKANAGEARFMDTRPDEQERTITIKSTAVSLYFALKNSELSTEEEKAEFERKQGRKKIEVVDKSKVVYQNWSNSGIVAEEETAAAETEATESTEAPKERLASDGSKLDELATGDETPFLINLIDSPGHVDFSSEVTAALRVTDGALVVVDCIEGVCVQTETVLRQAIAERIKPILFVNKLDRIFLELKMDLEEAYQTFSRAIESVNVVIATYKDDFLGDVQVEPQDGTVGFGSGLHGWGFTIQKFATFYAAKTGVPRLKWMQRLWGENYVVGGKTFITKNTDSKGAAGIRCFNEFILKPISTLFDAIMNDKMEVANNLMKKLDIVIPKESINLTGKPLLKAAMQAWLPAADALLSMVVNHLPSPTVAQRYRVENLYSGPMDDDLALAIRLCDPNGPLMLYVSKMVPTSEKGRFYAFGRVFSGIVSSGQNVRIQGPDYVPGKKSDLYTKKIQRTILMMGRYIEQLLDCPAGNIVGLVGVDQYLLKCGTITNHTLAHNFISMKYSVSPVVRVTVDVTNASDLPKLMEGLKRLQKSDPLVQCFTAPTGEHIVAGAGELHLEICIKDLRDDFMKGAPIKIGTPIVNFCETVRAVSDMQCLAKSANKHNRIFMTCEPLSEDFSTAVDKGEINPDEEPKVLAKKLAENFNIQVDPRKIWSFGGLPDGRANILVDATKAVQYLHEIKDSVCTGFLEATCSGIYTEEAMRGIKFNIEDVTLHPDAIHRGIAQIVAPMKRVMWATEMRSKAALMEPMYLCDITVPQNAVSGVYQCLNARRGVVENLLERLGTPLVQVKAYLPVLESFGFCGHLRQLTSGQAFPQMIFSHWSLVNGDIEDPNSSAFRITTDIRKRKGLKDQFPQFGDYNDKL